LQQTDDSPRHKSAVAPPDIGEIRPAVAELYSFGVRRGNTQRAWVDAMNLDADDFRMLIDILKKHPDFNTAQERVLLLKRVFKGSDRGNALLSIINPEGNPRAAATEVLAKVAEFGQLDYARPALGVFLASILDDVGDDEAGSIKVLFEKYPLDVQILRARPVASWRIQGEDPTEKIIGENTLLPVAVFEAAVAAARAVVRIRVNPTGGPGWVGTGFLVAGNRIMTCNHVIRNQDHLKATICEFNYQLDVAGHELRVIEVPPNPDGRFQTDPVVDFSVFELMEAIAPDLAVPVRFAKGKVREGQRVALIQHPGGRPKEVSMHQNRVTYADQQIVQYVTSTEPGSSGCPVFNNATFEVVAVHNKGGHLRVPGKHGSYLRNEGSSTMAILERLKDLDAGAYRQLTTGA
jgi:V8-like Glu-specific endopeptidase